MTKLFQPILAILFLSGILLSCKKDEQVASKPVVKFIFRFDSTQARLNNIGQPSAIAAGNAAQSPVFNKMSAHYVELAPVQLLLRWVPEMFCIGHPKQMPGV
jgi:hypothetical protein